MSLRTSKSHPLQIDHIEHRSGGRIGMSLCPGRRDPEDMDDPWSRNLDTDLLAIRDWGTSLLVTLIEEKEFDLLQIPEIGAKTKALNMDWLHLPIADFSVPSADFESVWPVHSANLISRIRSGERIVLHCRGGLGRTGLVAAWLLVELGFNPTEAIKSVRKARPHTIETSEQEQYVLDKAKIAHRN